MTAPTFQEHMTSLHKADNESLHQVLKSLQKQKIIPNNLDGLNVTDIAISLSERTIELSSRVQVTSDLSLKIELLSVQIVLMNSLSLISTALNADANSDIRRINALLYLR